MHHCAAGLNVRKGLFTTVAPDKTHAFLSGAESTVFGELKLDVFQTQLTLGILDGLGRPTVFEGRLST